MHAHVHTHSPTVTHTHEQQQKQETNQVNMYPDLHAHKYTVGTHTHRHIFGEFPHFWLHKFDLKLFVLSRTGSGPDLKYLS